MPPFADSPAGATLTVRVTPRAGRTALTTVSNGQLLIRVAAAPVDGAANEALVEFLSKTLGVPRRSVLVASGERGRVKRLTFPGWAAADLDRRLASALADR